MHIGPHKTGSTAIQVSLFSARDALLEHGVYYPRKARRRRNASEQLFAAVKAGKTGPLKQWDALVAEVRDAPGSRVCVSDEQFGKGSRAIVERIVADLGGDRTHIVAVARPFDSYLPSQYQERVKAGRPETYDEWLRIVFGDSKHFERGNVWNAHDSQLLVDRWLEFVDPERFTLIIADESDRTQLPRVFEGMLGLPTGLLELVPDKSNQSLVLAEVEMIRAVNRALRDQGVPTADFQSWLKHAVRAASAYDGPRPGPRKPPLPQWALDLVTQRSDARIEAIKAMSVNVIGDPEWLRVNETTAGDVNPAELQVNATLAGDALARAITAALS